VLTPSVSVDAVSLRHGAALALRQLLAQGCDISAPHAHVDVTGPDGASHMVLVEEVLDWLGSPEQASFVDREGLDILLRTPYEGMG
jgi:hypothetical protein